MRGDGRDHCADGPAGQRARREIIRSIGGANGNQTDHPHRSSSGKKLYAVRDSSGKFKDIQTYKRAQGADMKRKSEAESKSTKKK